MKFSQNSRSGRASTGRPPRDSGAQGAPPRATRPWTLPVTGIAIVVTPIGQTVRAMRIPVSPTHAIAAWESPKAVWSDATEWSDATD